MFRKQIKWVAIVAMLATGGIQAGTLTDYTTGDVLVCFRKSGAVNDLVVDVGPVSTFTNTTVNQRIPIGQYTGSQLALVGTNSVIWSAFTWLDDGTLFVSRGRNSLNTKTSAWAQLPQASQLLVAGDMGSIVLGAATVLGYNGRSTSSAIIEPDDASNGNPNYTQGQSYVGTLGPNLDFNGDFVGKPEKTAPSNFTTAGAVIRSDFYMIPPSDTSSVGVRFLGYFELNTNGVMTFVANPTPPTVVTVAASAVTAATAQLNCTVNPNADSTTLFFQYGLTSSYGSSSVANNIGTIPGSYSLSISNLATATPYHFRAVAYNGAGTNYGADLTFTTSSGGAVVAPGVISLSHSNIIFYITFITGGSGTYTLRSTNSTGLTAPRTNWPAIASIGGNGSVLTLQSTNSEPNQFYIITAK